MVLFLLLWPLLMVLVFSSNTDRHFQAKQTVYAPDLIPQNELLATYTDVPSKIQCTYFCLEVEGCLMFFYAPDNGHCGLCKLNLSPQTAPFLQYMKGVQLYAAVTGICPEKEGYKYEPTLNICIRLSSDTLTWLKAVDSCAREKAGLFRPDTVDKIAYIGEMLKNSNELKTRWFHLGASDAVQEGTWVWWTGEEIDANTTNWIPGSPDNYKGNQNCMAMDPRSNHMWNDISCENNIFYYICEKILI